MAEKLDRRSKINPEQAAAPQPAAQENELEILNPEREVTLGGKVYTIREYSHLEWLKLLVKVEALVEMIAQRFQNNSIADMSFNDILNVIGEHIEQLLPTVLQSAGMTIEEFNALRLDEVEALLLVWWGVNHHFFLQRARAKLEFLVAEQALRQKVALSTLAKSTPPLSETGTPLQTSGATPSGN